MNSVGSLVYFQPRPGQLPVLIGRVCQFDAADEYVDEGCVAVQWRGRTMSAPLAALRPVQ